MDFDFQADIGANIRDFQREMREVDEIIRETALGAEAMISADTSEFMQGASAVEAVTEAISSGESDVDIGADIDEFVSGATSVQETIEVITSENNEADIGADISEFVSEAAAVQATVAAIATGVNDVEIGADISEFMAEAAVVEAVAEQLERDRITVRIRARWTNYQNTMGAIANFSRSIGEVTAMTSRGISISLSPAIIPILASVVGLLGNLGPMLGTVAGSTFALGSAFATAGIGAAAFGAIAVTNLKDIFGANEELGKLQEKLAKADTGKERTKILAEMKRVQSGLNEEQQAGLTAINDLKETWSGIAGSLQTQTIEIFTKALSGLSGVLTTLKPMFTDVMNTANGLMDSLGRSIDSAPMQAFFDYLNTTAGPMLDVITKSVGNFIQGFLNMMVAFGPLAEDTAAGFLRMSEGFAAWSSKLGESKKFQAFVDYVKENMPKIRSIFGDAITGIVNLFGQFSGSSSDMMTSLQDMMERFKNWSSTLSENQGFQNFMNYIKESGPQVVALIGNIVDVIVEVVQALAPMGAKILDVINKVADFTGKLLENHSWIGKVGAVLLVMGGAFLAILPNVVALNSLLGGLITKMIVWVAKTTWAAAVQVAKWIWMGVTATANAIKMAAAWTLATGKAMVIAVAKMIASAAVFVAKWLWMGLKALLHAAKVAAAWALSTGAAMVTAVAKMIATSAVFVAKWLWMGAQALFAAARMAAAWFIALGPIGWVTAAIIGLVILIIANWDKVVAWTKKAWTTTWNWIKETWQKITTKTSEAASKMWSTIKEKFTSIVNSIKEKMSQAKTWIQNKWEEAKTAAVTKLIALVTSVKKFFTDIVNKVKEKMGDAVDKVSEKVGEMPGKVLGFASDMLSAGADLIQGLIDGAVGMASDAIGAVKDIAGDMVDAALSFFKIKSPSRVFMEMGAYVSEGLAVGVGDKARMAVSEVSRMAAGMTNAFNPQLAMADMRASATLDTSISRADMGVVRHSLAAELDGIQVEQPDIVLVMDGREVGRVTAPHVKNEMNKSKNLIRRG